MVKRDSKTSANPANVRRVLVEYHELRELLKVNSEKRHSATLARRWSTPPVDVSAQLSELEKERRALRKQLSHCMARICWIGAEFKHGRRMAGRPGRCCQELYQPP
jgi:hypothetical protein